MTEPQYYEYLLQRSKRMNGWQPIESIPKDGTKVLVNDAGSISVAYLDEFGKIIQTIPVFKNIPIHWKPLPEPPIIVEQDSPTNPSQSPL